MIASDRRVLSFLLKIDQKGKDHIRCEMIQHKRFGSDLKPVGGKWDKEGKCIPIRLDGMAAHPLYMRKIVAKKLMQTRRKLHFTTARDLTYSINPMRCLASLTLR
jgi:hypothetical protein